MSYYCVTRFGEQFTITIQEEGGYKCFVDDRTLQKDFKWDSDDWFDIAIDVGRGRTPLLSIEEERWLSVYPDLEQAKIAADAIMWVRGIIKDSI